MNSQLLESFNQYYQYILSDELKSIDFLISIDKNKYEELLFKRKQIIRNRKLERILNLNEYKKVFDA